MQQENTSLERKEKADAEKRIQAARQQTSERNVADHYKLLGLQRSCTTEEVRLLASYLSGCRPFDEFLAGNGGGGTERQEQAFRKLHILFNRR